MSRRKRPGQRFASRFSTAITGGILGGLIGAVLAYYLCGVLWERNMGVDAASWPGFPWLSRSAMAGALCALACVPRWSLQSATFKGLLVALLPAVTMLTGVLPPLAAEPSPMPDSGLQLVVTLAWSACWGLVTCWWMKWCGST